MFVYADTFETAHAILAYPAIELALTMRNDSKISAPSNPAPIIERIPIFMIDNSQIFPSESKDEPVHPNCFLLFPFFTVGSDRVETLIRAAPSGLPPPPC
jgi:hypothetical protein